MKSFVIKGARVFTAERELKELDVKEMCIRDRR